MKFSWDMEKERKNTEKHGIGFPEAAYVFADRLALTRFDDGYSSDEDRWVTLGRSASGRLLVIIYTYRKRGGRETVRIISARKATKQEIRQYEERSAGR